MGRVQIKLNSAAVSQLLRSSEMQAILTAKAQRIASAAGPGHRVDSHIGAARARATVLTDTHAARRAEATDRSLTRAIDAGRG